MASSSLSAPAPSSRSWEYHVFLSFSGEDTRKTFVGHLYSALVQQGIYTYKDDETLPRGKSIGPSLMTAIEQSQIAVVVFSKNYANSSWCLDELVYIMKCKNMTGQIVMPIFYDVDPTVVRKQKQEYKEAFSKHELENNKKVESWRKALVDASNISGWEPKHIANGHESEGIKEIVITISRMLHPVTSPAIEKLIGIASRLEGLKSKLQIGLGGVRMVGVWGVGGGGKTTLASSVYSEICGNFDGCCFVENIREESSKYGLVKLQEKVLSNILKQRDMVVNRVEEGRCLINDRFRHRNVLLVLDDVDHLDHLHALAGSHNWFGEGSRIIITTRDNHLLCAHEVDVIYSINLLDDDEAIELFHKHVPHDYRRIQDIELLSKSVVSYAGGLPLALKVLGSFLCDKDINEWMSALARLKEIPDTDIVEKLKISFDGLKPVEKELFLDIACFFRRVDKDKAMEILHAYGFHPVIGVKVLIQKALITISDGMFDMHDLVQEMGHYIVRGEHPNNPEKHSRVWKREDVQTICAMDSTTELDMIEAIRSEYNMDDPLQRLPPIVANMKNLRWIDWEGDLASPLPTNFPPRKLCCLIMYGISQKQLWHGYKYLPNLRIMELYGLGNLIVTPDFNGLPNLERFKLDGCCYLEEIHPSIGHLEKLVYLSIENCFCLKKFPSITQLKKLETLTFQGCPALFGLSDIQQNMGSLQHVHLDNNRKEVASDKKYFSNFLVTCWACGRSNLRGDSEIKKPSEDLIDVEYCLEGPSLPHNNMNHHIGLQFLHRGLRELDLSYCGLGNQDIGSDLWELSNLKKLNLTANKFSQLNFSRLRLPRLKWLNMSCCRGLVELSELPSSIAVLIADFCTSLESLGDISNCKWLWKVSLRGENKLGSIADMLLHFMLQGNAIEGHFISVTLEHQIPEGFLSRLFTRKTFTLHLLHDWYNDFCGFLVCIVTNMKYPIIDILIKHELDEDSRFGVWQEFNEAQEPEYDGTVTFVGYVSFSSLSHAAFLNPSYNMIKISIDDAEWSFDTAESYIGAELVPKKSKGDEVPMTKLAIDWSEFWDNQRENGNTFTIQHDLKSSIKILWHPTNNRL